MSDLPSEFEQQLKQIKPTSCDTLQADTFYRAGWAAREAQVENTRLPEQQRKPLFRPFATGLICGLCTAVCVALSAGFYFSDTTPRIQNTADSVVHPATREVVVSSAMNAADDDVSLQPPAQDHIGGIRGLPRHAVLASQSLSLAARIQWDSSLNAIAKPADSVGSKQTPATARTPRQQLRSFPATRQIIQQYL